MSDVKCPSCQADQNINHDDGYGYDEDSDHKQVCNKCGYEFKFTTSIIYSYSVHCQEGDHDMQPFGIKWPGMFQCSKCDFFERREENLEECANA
ncbi:hypothetical protein MnBA_37980 [Marinobacterium sp. BA1]